jgi:hypothetical protein
MLITARFPHMKSFKIPSRPIVPDLLIANVFGSKRSELFPALSYLLLHPFGFIHILIGQSDHPIHFSSFANMGRPAN